MNNINANYLNINLDTPYFKLNFDGETNFIYKIQLGSKSLTRSRSSASSLTEASIFSRAKSLMGKS